MYKLDNIKCRNFLMLDGKRCIAALSAIKFMEVNFYEYDD